MGLRYYYVLLDGMEREESSEVSISGVAYGRSKACGHLALQKSSTVVFEMSLDGQSHIHSARSE